MTDGGEAGPQLGAGAPSSRQWSMDWSRSAPPPGFTLAIFVPLAGTVTDVVPSMTVMSLASWK